MLVRHGVTPWNRVRRFQGHTDIGLDDEGHEQARRTGQRLRHWPLAAVYSSDLARALETAAPIALAQGLAVTREPELRERFYGSFEGRTHDELLRDQAVLFERWRAREPDFELPQGGETLRAFAARVELVLRRIAAAHPGARVAVVSHGGVLDCAYRLATGLALAAVREHQLRNASINLISWDGDRFALRGWGDIAHLAAVDQVSAPVG